MQVLGLGPLGLAVAACWAVAVGLFLWSYRRERRVQEAVRRRLGERR